MDDQPQHLEAALLEQLPDPVIAVDAARRITYLNAAACARYGVSLAKVRGRPAAELYRIRWRYPGEEEAALHTLRELGVWRGEYTHVTRSGHEVEVETTARALRGPHGEEAGFVAVVRNVGERHRAAHRAEFLARLHALVMEHREARPLLRAALPALAQYLDASGATWNEVLPGDGGARLVEWHFPGGALAQGVRRADDFVTHSAVEVLRQGRALVLADVTRAPDTATSAERFRAAGVGAVLCVPVVAPQGPLALLTVLSTAPRPWRADEEDLVRDVATRLYAAVERDRAEQALRHSEERFRKVYENAPTGIAINDWQGRFLQCNAAYAALVGYSEDELRQMPFSRLIHPEDLAANLALVDRLQRGEVPFFEIENRYVHRSGRTVWVHKYISVLRDEAGTPVSLVALVTDVTARRDAEAGLRQAHAELEERVLERPGVLQQQADQPRRLAAEVTLVEQRARKQLAALLHDQVQQLLASAKMNVQLLARDGGDRPAALERAVRCLDDAIACTRTLSVELSPPLLHEFGLAAAFEWLAEWMQEKHHLTVHVTADAAANPAGDDVRTLLFESVRELLFNAVKHAGVREAWLDLAAHDDERLRVTVWDEGRGFELPTTQSPTHGPAGLGLFSIRERLALLGGSFEVDSALGRGARFTLVAPRAAPREATDAG